MMSITVSPERRRDGGIFSRKRDVPDIPRGYFMNTRAAPKHNLTAIKWLTYLMFIMFAMTTDSVGTIIPKVIRKFHLSMTAAGAFHYAPMIAIAVAGIFLGYLADKLDRKKTIILGLVLFALNPYLFAVGNSSALFLTLLIISGASIGIFKTGALALVGDISLSAFEHTTIMNTVEGFLGVGAIIGPAIVARLLESNISWKWLYVIAGTICVLLIISALLVKYPKTAKSLDEPIDLKRTLRMMKNRYALGHPKYGFVPATIFAALLFAGPLLNWIYNPSRERLSKLDSSEYQAVET
jgi:FHS family L-fucose permease-like MFS transporter